MLTISNLPNLAAMIVSLVAMTMLVPLALRIGGEIGKVLRFVVAGVFLSVFLHAGLELAELAGLLSAGWLMAAMGTAITLGSAAFCAAGLVGLRALR